jgi:hypothetical protein
MDALCRGSDAAHLGGEPGPVARPHFSKRKNSRDGKPDGDTPVRCAQGSKRRPNSRLAQLPLAGRPLVGVPLRLSNCVWVAQSSRSTLPCVVGDAGVRACTTAFHRRPRWQAHGGSISANEVPDYLARKIRDDCPDEPPRYGAATPSGCRPDRKCHCHRSGFFMGLDRGPGFVAMLRQGLPVRVEDANRDRQPWSRAG